MARYPRSGSPNETAPDLLPHLKNHLLLRSEDLQRPKWGELRAWLAKELALYRATSGNPGTPTEQKAELKRYIETMRAMEQYLDPEALPPAIAGLIHSEEYGNGITHDTDHTAYAYIVKKRLIAERIYKGLKPLQGSKGGSGLEKEYRLLAALAQRISDIAPTAKADDVLAAAAHILNDRKALGANYEPFGVTRNPEKNSTLLSTDPRQIRRKFKGFGLSM